jgi:hypothetical protein
MQLFRTLLYLILSEKPFLMFLKNRYYPSFLQSNTIFYLIVMEKLLTPFFNVRVSYKMVFFTIQREILWDI